MTRRQGDQGWDAPDGSDHEAMRLGALERLYDRSQVVLVNAEW